MRGALGGPAKKAIGPTWPPSMDVPALSKLRCMMTAPGRVVSTELPLQPVHRAEVAKVLSLKP